MAMAASHRAACIEPWGERQSDGEWSKQLLLLNRLDVRRATSWAVSPRDQLNLLLAHLQRAAQGKRRRYICGRIGCVQEEGLETFRVG
jgi:hypothetical protein